MQITERMLLDNYDGLTNGLDCISIVNGKKIYWTYRTGQDSDGYNCVCDRKDAGEITLEYDRTGVIALDHACDDHPAVLDIIRDQAAVSGDQVRPPTDQRTITIRFRVTPTERDTIQSAAEEAGCTMSQYIRSKVL